jgi:hypothetical protein
MSDLVFEVLGFFATDDPALIASWLAQARERYTRLEQALLPFQRVVEELAPNWQPKAQTYWQRTMEHLVPLRHALEACSSLFEREQSREDTPIPLAVLGCHHGYSLSLSSVTREFNEVGILLTSHSAASYSREVAHIRQRQEVLGALRTLCDGGRKAIAEARTWLDAFAVEQQEKSQRGRVPLASRRRRVLARRKWRKAKIAGDQRKGVPG